jgi:NAD(P)-dependent dehydrogenase (short-subunit alcohol dehydrogenase family)
MTPAAGPAVGGPGLPLHGRVAIVTGAASGLCRQILTRFVRAGAAAVSADISEEAGVRVVEALREDGHEALFVRTDVRDGRQVDALVAQAVAAYGRVDVLVHGAGVGIHKTVVELSDDEWDLQVDVQLRGGFLTSRSVARQLIEQRGGGRILFIGSTAGNNARIRSGPHAASKAGLVQLARVLALELGAHGITCNVVAPGLVDISGLSTALPSREYQRAFISQVPLGRLGLPDEVADACLFLASDQANYITGQVLYVDGGYSAGKTAVQGPHDAALYGQMADDVE